jgi:uncharacterized RDD family membrane protein YckC
MKGLQDWFVQCVLKMRPLAPQVGWVWAVAGVFLLLYLFIALVFQKPVRACVDELERRPATTFLLGLLTKLVLPVLLVLLIATGLGVFVIPFILAALLLGVIVGKVAILEWFGYRFSKTLPPVVAFLIGALILTIFYIIPIFGLIMFAVTGLWGLGATVSAVFGSLRREMPDKPTATLVAPVSPAPGATPGPISVPGTIAPLACNVGAETATPVGTSVPPSLSIPAAVPPAVPEALGYPRATFWERLGAGLIDLILISILSVFVGGPPLGFLVAAAYFIGLWMWKGTTVGGVVVQLRVVRQDGQKITFPVALVRLLIGVFSMMVLFLGFLWIAWDGEKQSWHDKVAGTVVVRMPKGTPLLVL